MKKSLLFLCALSLLFLVGCGLTGITDSETKKATIYFSNPDGWAAAVGIGRISGDEFKAKYNFTEGGNLYTSSEMQIEPGNYDVYYKVRFSSGWGDWRYLTSGFSCQSGRKYKATFHGDGWGGGEVSITTE
jgi:hypothetical protein